MNPTLASFFPTLPEGVAPKDTWTKAWSDSSDTMPWESQAAPAEPPAVVHSTNKSPIVVERAPLTREEVKDEALSRRLVLKRVVDYFDELNNNGVGPVDAKNKRQRAENLKSVQAAVRRWDRIIKDLDSSKDHLEIYYKEIRGHREEPIVWTAVKQYQGVKRR